ncbi:MAG: helix-turn-helix domain-containing protein [Lentisphaerae bacterium]|nr:helix-turn-helix domain-containing protein [Lentisphaerota bacterium]
MEKFTWREMFHLEHLEIGTKYMPSGTHMSNRFHGHIYSELAIVVSANGAIHCAEGKSHPLENGDVLLIHPDKIHGYKNAGFLEIFNILYCPDKLPLPPLDGSTMRLFPLIILPHTDTGRALEKPLLKLNKTELNEAKNTALALQKELEGNAIGKHLRAFGFFINLLTLICRAGGGEVKKEHETSLTAAIQYLNLHHRERPDTDLLAHRANMSRRVFFRKFHEFTGMSPYRYALKKSLSTAEELLMNSSITLSEIAYECGFYDSNHLSRVFKAEYGTSPGKFRKEHSISSPENNT